MLNLLVYLFCFVLLFFISKQQYRYICFVIINLLSSQLVLSYYANIGKIQDVLFYLVVLSFIDLLMISSVITNNILNKDYHIIMSIVALGAVFSTLLTIFDYYRFYYFQASYMVVMEYIYFTIKQQERFTILYYLVSLVLIIPHLID